MSILAKFDAEKTADMWADAAPPLSVDEAKVLRSKLWIWSPVTVLACQALVGVLLVGSIWALTAGFEKALSALAGVACVVLPGVVFAHGMRRVVGSGLPGLALSGFVFWELIKLALTVGLLCVVPLVLVKVEWLFLLAGLVVTLKASWLALIPRRAVTGRRPG